MLDLTETRIDSLVVHRVGNKLRDEGIITSQNLHSISSEQEAILLNYFLRPMPELETLQFVHSSELRLNEVFTFCRASFSNPAQFLPQTIKILKHLYACSEHPKIRAGDVLFVYFSGIVYLNKTITAIGIFKTERKDSFLRITSENQALRLNIDEGVNLRAPDKGCLILHTEESNGYRVLCIDKDAEEARYWRNRFLNLAPLQDDHYMTKGVLGICQVICDQLGESASQQEKIALANTTVDYFLKNDSFDLEDFSSQVLKDKALESQFKERKRLYETENGIAPITSFPISKPAVKTVKRALKSLIKLDTKVELRLNFTDMERASHFLERGFDKHRKMYFYKVYFNREI